MQLLHEVKIKIDVDFDVRTDSESKDPDYASKTLRKLHQILWSNQFRNHVLIRRLHNYLDVFSQELNPILTTIPKKQIDNLQSVGSTIGAKILFPGQKVYGFQTTNQSRGFSTAIKDRFDLTLEWIRLFYLNEPSALSNVLRRYSEFFELFGDFRIYVDFFLLQDLVEGSKVKIFFHLIHLTTPVLIQKALMITWLTRTTQLILLG